MSETPNPYAPPAVLEPGIDPYLDWQVIGQAILVKHGTTLPKLDLDTGETGPTLIPRKRTHIRTNFVSLVIFGISLPLLFWSASGIPPGLWFLLLVVVILGANSWQAVQGFRGIPNKYRVEVHDFICPIRKKAQTQRRIAQFVIILMVLGLIYAPGLIEQYVENRREVAEFVFLLIVACILLGGLWRVLTQGTSRTFPATSGWMKIFPVHETALEHLRKLDAVRDQQKLAEALMEKRLVRTFHLHRYPRWTLSEICTDLPMRLKLALLKLLRAPRLSFVVYDAPETRTPESVHPQVRETVRAWLSAHPDWVFVTAGHQDSPAGKFTKETAIYFSPDLVHGVVFTATWMTELSGRAAQECHFITRVADGSIICTHQKKHPALPYANVREFLAAGDAERTFEAHVERCGPEGTVPFNSMRECEEAMREHRDETERLLTDLGYQSEVRVAR